MHALLVAGALLPVIVDHADGRSELALAEDTSGVVAAPRVTDGTPQTVTVAVVLLDLEGSPPQTFTPADAAARMATVRAYYQELSYGIWNIESEVLGPFTVARPASCDLDTIGNLARATVDLSGFDHVAVTLPGNDQTGLDCACGVAWLGRTPAQPDPRILHTSLYTCTDANAFAHELGHAFGLHHASKAHCAGEVYRRGVHDACTIEEYGNQFNTMGNGLGHMNAFQKGTMRWLDGCNNVRVSRDAVFELVAIPLASDDVQSLQIPTGDSRDGNPLFYYVEYRNPDLAGFNAGGDPPREQGPGVHVDVAPDLIVDDGDRRPLLLDLSDGTPDDFVDPRLTAGRSYVDPDGRVTIAVLAIDGERATVQVSFPGGGGGTNTCNDGSAPPEPGTPDAGVAGDPDGGAPAVDDDATVTGGCCSSGGGPAGSALLAALLACAAVAPRRGRRAAVALTGRRARRAA
jgi:hypothetical protein